MWVPNVASYVRIFRIWKWDHRGLRITGEPIIDTASVNPTVSYMAMDQYLWKYHFLGEWTSILTQRNFDVNRRGTIGSIGFDPSPVTFFRNINQLCQLWNTLEQPWNGGWITNPLLVETADVCSPTGMIQIEPMPLRWYSKGFASIVVICIKALGTCMNMYEHVWTCIT